MNPLPTPAEQERRIRELEAEVQRLRAAEEEWKRTDALLRLITENVTDVIWTRDMNLRLTYLNPSIERIRGYTVEEIMRQGIDESMTPASAALAREVFLEELAREARGENDPDRSKRMELEMTRKDGGTVWTEVTVSFMRDAQNRAVGLVGVTRDISDRKAVEDARRESELKFRSIFDFSPQAVALTSAESGRLMDVNQGFCDVTGYAREEILGRTTTELGFYSEENRGRFIRQLQERGEVRDLEMSFRIRDGSLRTGLMFARPLRVGERAFILSLIVDITERKEMEARLQHSSKMEAIGTLAGGIAHDFNNILSIILGNTEMAAGEVPAGSRTRFYLEEARNASLRARELVRQILAFSRRTERERRPLRVGGVLEESIELLRRSVPSAIAIRHRFSAARDTVLADPTQIRQVLINLCTNAAHAMREKGGDLDVRLEDRLVEEAGAGGIPPELAPGRYLVLSVRDTGHGIEPEILPRIFDPYFTTRDVGEGSGMGLAVVHGIVKEYQGAVEVESRPGEGALFRVFLPLMEEEAMSEEVYERLADALTRAGGAVPIVRCEEFTALNRELFSPEEAALAAEIPPGLLPVEEIVRHTGRAREEVVPLLERLADKALVFHQKRDGRDLYKLMPVLPGFFEFQFMKGGASERDRKLARLFQDYFDRAWSLTQGVDPKILKALTPFARVIPVEEEIEGGNVVHPHERVSEYIRSADCISVSTCYCRHHGELLGQACDKPKENCMAFGPNARFVAERGYGRLVSPEEAQRVLDEAEAAGLVHMSSNTSKYIDFICNCCPCHCGILKSFQKMEMPALGAVSAFRLRIDAGACTGCEDCVDRCPMGALAVEEDLQARVDPKRCIGCGVCNSACPAGALAMERVPEAPDPPWDRKALTASVLESIRRASEGLA